MAGPKEDRTGQDTDIHVLMPSMSYACGGNILTAKGRSVFSAATEWDAVSCAACREQGQERIWRASKAQQGHDPDSCHCASCRHGRVLFGDEPNDLFDLL